MLRLSFPTMQPWNVCLMCVASRSLPYAFAQVMSSHKLNASSSRSHCLFQLHLHSWVLGCPEDSRKSRLTLVDLAGSERAAQTGAVEGECRVQGADKRASAVSWYHLPARYRQALCSLRGHPRFIRKRQVLSIGLNATKTKSRGALLARRLPFALRHTYTGGGPGMSSHPH